MLSRALSTAIALSTLQLVSADFADSVDSVSSLAVGLSSQVNAWSSQQGLIAALGIQNAFPTLSSAVVTLSNAAGSIQDSDVDPAKTSALATSIANLLAALTSKAKDFSSVGASQIVQNDVSSLEGPSVDIVKDIIKAVSGDCEKISSLTDALNDISNGFSSADSAYSISPSSFPAVPSCAAPSSSSSSSSAAPPPPSSTTSAPASSSPASGPTSTTSAAPSTSAAPTSAAPVGTKFAQPALAVSSLADALSSKVNAWDAGQGLIAALGIQNAFPDLSSAVVTLSNAAGSISDGDIDPAGTNALATSISNLLAALTSKAGDFSSVGASQIVQNDISSLQGPSVAIVQDIVNAVKDDCDKVGSLTGALSSIANAFNSADSAYSIGTSSFPAIPSCSGNGGGNSGSATTTSAPTTSTAPSVCYSTVTNQGFSCSANNHGFNLWSAANKAINKLLNDVNQAANSIGLGLIADIATLGTTLVSAINSAHNQLKNLECLAPSQAADFFSSVTQTINTFTTLLTSLNKNTGILKFLPGATSVIQFALKAAVSAVNSYIGQVSSFLQAYKGNYPCYSVKTANSAISLLNDAIKALESAFQVTVAEVSSIQVTNCRDATTVITGACGAAATA